MQTSESIGELITALAQAQGEFKAVPKSRENPHLHNKYATLDGVIATIRGPLSKNGLAFVQPLATTNGSCWLETRILHKSGEWIATEAEIPEWAGNRGVNALQSFGGALTYMRRYMLTSMLGINAEEDIDGNGGNGGNGEKSKPEAKKKTTQRARATPTATTDTTKQPEALPPEKWASIPVPENWGQLWGEKRWALLGYSHKKHVDNTVGKQNFRTPAEAWEFLLQHRQDKLDAERKPEPQVVPNA
jgi:hypothetical protein